MRSEYKGKKSEIIHVLTSRQVQNSRIISKYWTFLGKMKKTVKNLELLRIKQSVIMSRTMTCDDRQVGGGAGADGCPA